MLRYATLRLCLCYNYYVILCYEMLCFYVIFDNVVIMLCYIIYAEKITN